MPSIWRKINRGTQYLVEEVNMAHIPGQWSTFGNTDDLQSIFDVAVVMPTIGRSEVLHAVKSVFAQTGVARIQLLIGLDKPGVGISDLLALLATCPAHITVNLFYPGYSTNVRHGGVHPTQDGGALRSILTCLANAKYVAYLDDDNWWGETHLCDLLKAIENHAWAYSLRWFVDPNTKEPLCVDEWESVGIGRGVFYLKFGGFVDPNCLMIDKVACWPCVSLWTLPLANNARGMSADRNIYHFLQNHSKPGQTNNATTFYTLNPTDGLHADRLGYIEKYKKMQNGEITREELMALL